MLTPPGRLTNSSAEQRLGEPSVRRIASSPSVTVYWLDKELALLKVREAARRTACAHPEILRILMFGSMARGDAVPGSDADLLLVLSESDTVFLDRIPTYLPTGCDFGIDVFPYTEAELTRMLAEGHAFVREALSEEMSCGRRLANRGSLAAVCWLHGSRANRIFLTEASGFENVDRDSGRV